jgi:hypothetical protein
VDDSGCGTQPGEVYPVKYIDRISPNTIFPFRYNEDDIDPNLRKVYFGFLRIDFLVKLLQKVPNMYLTTLA